MLSRRRVLDYCVAILLVLLPALTLRSNLRDPSELSSLDKAVVRITSPLQAGISWVVEGVGSVMQRYFLLVDVEEENEELRRENERLRERLVLALRGVGDTANLEALAGLRQREQADSVGARVIARSANGYFRVTRISIDRGDKDVAVGMPVINSSGLVGRILHVFGKYSDVLLISDPSSALDVTIPRVGANGVLRGLGRDDSFACEIGMLDRRKKIEPGDKVVTSGLGPLPAGIAVGEVVRVTTVDYDLFQRVEVRPVVDLNDPGALLILVALPPPRDAKAGTRRDSTAYGLRAR